MTHVIAAHHSLLHNLGSALLAADAERSRRDSYIALSWDSIRSFLCSYVPSLETYISLSGAMDQNFAVFVDWVVSNGHQIDWRLPLTAYKYVHEEQGVDDHELCRECMLSAASQWCYLDKSRLVSCVVLSGIYADLCVLSEKSNDARLERGLYLLEATDEEECVSLFDVRMFDRFEGDLGCAEKVFSL